MTAIARNYYHLHSKNVSSAAFIYGTYFSISKNQMFNNITLRQAQGDGTSRENDNNRSLLLSKKI